VNHRRELLDLGEPLTEPLAALVVEVATTCAASRPSKHPNLVAAPGRAQGQTLDLGDLTEAGEPRYRIVLVGHAHDP
jgi:hypothetical protein